MCHLIAGMVGGGSTPTSCAQLCLLPHSASPAVPGPAAGLLNRRFVSAQGNNMGRGRGEKEGKARKPWCCRRIWGAEHGRTAGRSLQQTAKKGECRTLEGRAPWEPGLGRGVWVLPALVDAPSRHMKPCRSSHLTEAQAGASSGPFQPLLFVPLKEAYGLCWPRCPPITRRSWEGHPKSRGAISHRGKPQWWSRACSLSPRPGSEPSSPPPRS